MLQKQLLVMAALVALGFVQAADADPQQDALSKCLVSSASAADKRVLVRWIFSLTTLHPDLGDLTSLSGEQRDQINKDVASVYEVLLTKTCKSEAQAAARAGGIEAVGVGFNALADTAIMEILGHGNVEKGLDETVDVMDVKKFEEALLKK